MKHIFISYSRKDIKIMRHIAGLLQAKGLTTWTDEKLEPGTRAWKLAIEKAIEESGALVAVMSPDAKASEWVDRELEYARIRGIRIFPLLVRGDPSQSVPLELVTSQWVDISHPTLYVAGIEKLILALDHHLGVRRKSRTELLYEEVLRLAAKLPNVYYIALLSVDGLMMSAYSPDMEEDRVAAMHAATLSLAERISLELAGGAYRFNIICAADAMQFNLLLDDETILAFGIRGQVSVDTTLVILRQWWQPLLDLLEIKQPPL